MSQQASRATYLDQHTKRALRIYARRSGVTVLQKWRKPELIRAIVCAGK